MGQAKTMTEATFVADVYCEDFEVSRCGSTIYIFGCINRPSVDNTQRFDRVVVTRIIVDQRAIEALQFALATALEGRSQVNVVGVRHGAAH